jgi:hypothetical protein
MAPVPVTTISPATVRARPIALVPIRSVPFTVRLATAAEFVSKVVVPALMTTSSPASGTRLQLPALVQVFASLQSLEPTEVHVSANAAGA